MVFGNTSALAAGRGLWEQTLSAEFSGDSRGPGPQVLALRDSLVFGMCREIWTSRSTCLLIRLDSVTVLAEGRERFQKTGILPLALWRSVVMLEGEGDIRLGLEGTFLKLSPGWQTAWKGWTQSCDAKALVSGGDQWVWKRTLRRIGEQDSHPQLSCRWAPRQRTRWRASWPKETARSWICAVSAATSAVTFCTVFSVAEVPTALVERTRKFVRKCSFSKKNVQDFLTGFRMCYNKI